MSKDLMWWKESEKTCNLNKAYVNKRHVLLDLTGTQKTNRILHIRATRLPVWLAAAVPFPTLLFCPSSSSSTNFKQLEFQFNPFHPCFVVSLQLWPRRQSMPRHRCFTGDMIPDVKTLPGFTMHQAGFAEHVRLPWFLERDQTRPHVWDGFYWWWRRSSLPCSCKVRPVISTVWSYR